MFKDYIAEVELYHDASRIKKIQVRAKSTKNIENLALEKAARLYGTDNLKFRTYYEIGDEGDSNSNGRNN